MRFTLAAASAAVALALALAAGAPAAPPAQRDGFAGMHNAPFTVKKLTAGDAKKLGVPDALLPGKRVADTASVVISSGCGACINTCWTTTVRTGDDTKTGSYWEYARPVWCGNGAWITYRDANTHWQYVSIWYSADGQAGPFWDGGCIGCKSVHFTLYGYFSWHPPVLPVSHTTARLGVWLQAYGSAGYG